MRFQGMMPLFKFGGKNKGDNRYGLFEAWLDGVLLGVALPPQVAAFNFNLYGGAQGGYDIELIGAPGFDADDEDWACEELFASDLFSVPAEAAAKPAGGDAIEDIIDMVRRYLRQGRCRQVLLGSRAVGVGHVSGAITLVHLAPLNETVPDEAQPEELLPGEAEREEALPKEPFLAEAVPDEPSPGEPVPDIYTPDKPLADEPAPAPPTAGEPDAACYKLMRETRPRAMACAPKQNYGIRRYELLRGEPFTLWDDSFTFQYHAKKGDIPTDLLYNTMGWLLVSGRLRAALEEMGAEAEYFPVRVEEAQSGKQQPGYWVANLLCKRDALCPEKSEYTTVENKLFGAYRMVKRYALRRNALAGADIFKLPNHQEIPVFVTGRFKERMQEAGFTGLAYYPVTFV